MVDKTFDEYERAMRAQGFDTVVERYGAEGATYWVARRVYRSR